MPVPCNCSQNGHTVTIKITPPFGWGSLPPCTNELQNLGESISVLCIDISALTQLDNAGLGILILLRKQAIEQGLRVQLIAPGNVVSDILLLSKVDELFHMERSTELNFQVDRTTG